MLAGSLVAQDRYMVFFKDKANSTFSTSSPLAFLSQRSIDRRVKHNASITEEDLPVNATYVQTLKTTGAVVYFTSRWMNAALVEMSSSLEATVLGLPMVESIEFVAPNSKLSFVKDEFTIAQTFTNPSTISASTDAQIQMLGADQMHTDGYTGDGMLIAVFDGGFSGVNLNSPFQHIYDDNRIIAELDFVENSGNPYQYGDHGTKVLSCIAGSYFAGENSFIGTAPDATFILAVTEEVATEYRVEEYNWLLAAEYADSAGVDVISSSLGYTDFDDNSLYQMNYSYEDMDGQTTVISRAANLASSKGMLVVNSAGNSGNRSWYYIGSPADSPEVLAVGAVDGSETKASFSSFGPSFDGRIKPDVAAMGEQATVVNSSGNIIQNNGTSFAAPLMAGFVSCIAQKFPSLTSYEIIEIIKASGDQFDAPDNNLGYGIPNYIDVLEESLTLGSDITVYQAFRVYPNPMQWSVTIEHSAKEVAYHLVNLEGKTLAKGVLSFDESLLEIDPSMEAGVYFLQLRSDGNSETIKLLKN